MGSPQSPIMANLYMKNLEKRAMESAKSNPTIWHRTRYVDDTFVLWPHGEEQLEQFHKHLNKQHPLMHFTKEVEKENQIYFLDVLIKKEKGKFTTTVYRKPNDTGRYTHYSSHHHPKVKSGTVKCLAERARRICEEDKLKEEMSQLRNTFTESGYPRKLSQKI